MISKKIILSVAGIAMASFVACESESSSDISCTMEANVFGIEYKTCIEVSESSVYADSLRAECVADESYTSVRIGSGCAGGADLVCNDPESNGSIYVYSDIVKALGATCESVLGDDDDEYDY